MQTSYVKIYNDNKQLITETSDFKEIASHLNKIGVVFRQWETKADLQRESTNEDVLGQYQRDIDGIKEEFHMTTVDVLRLHAPNEAARSKFLKEHTHTEDEIRFFVEGSGLFVIHHEDHVYAVLCTKGDLISVPVGYKHWFDMGANPSFTVLRFFQDVKGWEAHYTGDDIATSIPHL